MGKRGEAMTESEALKLYAEKAAPVCGWPEWRCPSVFSPFRPVNCRLWLSPEYGKFVVQTGNKARTKYYKWGSAPRDYHEVLCLWREHCREWLVARGRRLLWDRAGYWFEENPCGVGECYADYDAALIAAVVVAGKEHK